MTGNYNISRAVGVRFENLTVKRDGRVILDNVTALAPCGGATALIGPNGAGKTTLIRCLLGEMPYEGVIQFVNSLGQPVAKVTLGYVPQQLQTDPQSPLRVYEFLSLGAIKRPLWLGCGSGARKRAQRLLSMVGGEKLLDSRLGQLSGGETRRVLLAAALGREPDLLILDEAEAGVDYRGERLFWDVLDRARKEYGFTLLIVSHNLPMAAHYATHVVCIKGGVLAQGQPRATLTAENLMDLFGAPIHLYPVQCANPGPTCPDCGAFGSHPVLRSNKPRAEP